MLNLLKSDHYKVLSKVADRPTVGTVDGQTFLYLNGNEWKIQDVLQMFYDLESSIEEHQVEDPTIFQLLEFLHPKLSIELGYDSDHKPKSLNALNGTPSIEFLEWMEKELDFTYIKD